MEPVWWDGDAVGYIDQRRLPGSLVRARAATVDEVVEAIRTLAVRGAPAIGVFAAYGVAVARRTAGGDDEFRAAVARIGAARPTAVNLRWAMDRLSGVEAGAELAEALAIHEEQRDVDRRIAEHGATLLPEGAAVMTYCNTGPLATGAGGTALGVIIEAARLGKKPRAIVPETRPLLQGARLTTFELAGAGVPATLIADGAVAWTMRTLGVRCAIVGADRIARNGDTANKIGTLAVAIAAAHHRIPFYVAAPRSTIDFSLSSGERIPIEERDPDEVRRFGGVATAPDGTPVYNPAFDVTPSCLIAGIVTEFGVCRPPYDESIGDLETRPSKLLAELAKR
jgi:methylthioribose-1-phosphate isomerase